MARWELTMKSPKESGYYLTVSRYGSETPYRYGKPSPTLYSAVHDLWNVQDSDGAEEIDKYNIPDLRNQGERASCIYAWFRPSALNPEKLEARAKI